MKEMKSGQDFLSWKELGDLLGKDVTPGRHGVFLSKRLMKE